MVVTNDFLAQGAIRSFEAARIYEVDAVCLYREGRHASACVLGVIAVEHVGQVSWLLRMLRSGASRPTSADFRKRWKNRDHEKRLSDGLIAFTFSTPTGVMQLKDEEHIARACQAAEAKGRRLPSEFHNLRTGAQYVQPSGLVARSGGDLGWSSPTGTLPEKAHELLMDAANSYGAMLMLISRDSQLVRVAQELGVWSSLSDTRGLFPPPEGDVHD